MNSKMWLAFGSTVAALCAGAAEFPSAGGDIASNGADGWNGAKPGSGAEAKFTKAGTYTASDNVTFGSIHLAASGLVFDLSAGNKTVTLDSTVPIADPSKAANSATTFKGGTWKMSGAQFKNIPEGFTLTLTDGCTFSDAGTFSPGFGLSGNTIRILEKSALQVKDMRLHQWGNSGTKMEVASGGRVSATGAITLETNATAGDYGGHWMDIHDAGSLVESSGNLKLATAVTDNGVRVRDGAQLKVGGTTEITTSKNWIEVLNGATATVANVSFLGADGRVTVSNATMTANKFSPAGTGGNRIEVLDGATMIAKEMICSSGGNTVLVRDSVYTGETNVQLGYTEAQKGNLFTVTGPKAVFNWAKNVFGSGCANVFELVDRATWNVGGTNLTLMNNASNNVLRVTGGAVLSNLATPAGDNNFYIGGDNETKGYNVMEVLDGATVSVERFFVRGVENRIIVSNATLKASSTSGYGIWLGHGANSRGNMLCVRGTTPSVQLNEYKSASGSAIRFEIPVEGYADGYVPVTARILNPGSTATERFEIECAAWAANPAATPKLVLMRCTTDISAANAAWILAQNPNLPENVKLKVNGGDVILYKPQGLTIILK